MVYVYKKKQNLSYISEETNMDDEKEEDGEGEELGFLG